MDRNWAVYIRQSTSGALESLDIAAGRRGFEQRQLKATLRKSYQLPSANVDATRTDAAKKMRQVGRKTFLLRNKRWVDATMTGEQEKKAVKLERYSQKYFDLAGHSQHVARYLALDSAVTVVVDGQAYTIDAP